MLLIRAYDVIYVEEVLSTRNEVLEACEIVISAQNLFVVLPTRGCLNINTDKICLAVIQLTSAISNLQFPCICSAH